MKTKVLTKDGKNTKEIEIPKIFSSEIREDIAQKCFRILEKIQPYGSYIFAGKLYSASGKLRHRRNKWKTAYGKGISRVPRKIFWRRGTQFYWEGATVPGTRGGRRAHPPKREHFLNKKKINKKEKNIAFNSLIASTASLDYIKKRYSTIKEKNISIKLPIVIKDDLLDFKSKDFFNFLNNNLNELDNVLLQKKNSRAGKGKLRNRRYKKSAGVLLVLGNKQKLSIKGIDIKRVNELNIRDLWPLGRIVIYTEQAIQDLEKINEKPEKKEEKETVNKETKPKEKTKEKPNKKDSKKTIKKKTSKKVKNTGEKK